MMEKKLLQNNFMELKEKIIDEIKKQSKGDRILILSELIIIDKKSFQPIIKSLIIQASPNFTNDIN